MAQNRRPGGDQSVDLATALAGLLPPLFLEARIAGGGDHPFGADQLITQLGLSIQAEQHVDLTILGGRKWKIFQKIFFSLR